MIGTLHALYGKKQLAVHLLDTNFSIQQEPPATPTNIGNFCRLSEAGLAILGISSGENHGCQQRCS